MMFKGVPQYYRKFVIYFRNDYNWAFRIERFRLDIFSKIDFGTNNIQELIHKRQLIKHFDERYVFGEHFIKERIKKLENDGFEVVKKHFYSKPILSTHFEFFPKACLFVKIAQKHVGNPGRPLYYSVKFNLKNENVLQKKYIKNL